MENLKSYIRNIPDFPQPGILFYDITTLLRDPIGFRESIDSLATPFANDSIDLVVGIESRGFIFGAAVADRLRAGFVPIRKPGKLPYKKRSYSYELEYGTDTLEMHIDGISPGQNVLVLDDLLATGGTVEACCKMMCVQCDPPRRQPQGEDPMHLARSESPKGWLARRDSG